MTSFPAPHCLSQAMLTPCSGSCRFLWCPNPHVRYFLQTQYTANTKQTTDITKDCQPLTHPVCCAPSWWLVAPHQQATLGVATQCICYEQGQHGGMLNTPGHAWPPGQFQTSHHMLAPQLRLCAWLVTWCQLHVAQ